MTMSRSFKDLVVWQRSMELVTEVYRISKQLPRSEVFGLSSQLRRSAVSIPSNIAEGSKRGSTKEFRHFVRVAEGSTAELETQLYIVQAEYPQVQCMKALALLDEIQRMLHGLADSMVLKTENKKL